MVAGLINGELIVSMTYEETMTSDFFEVWFQKFLLPTLTTPSVIIMDNARFHRMGKLELLCEKFGINFYLFLPTHLSTILLRKHGLISKSTSKRYYQVAIPFMRLFCLVLVSIDYSSRIQLGKKLLIIWRVLLG
ncbi:transposase [Streptococcus pneumoniae]|nr:transposase [Streptococcus pneumoniae]